MRYIIENPIRNYHSKFFEKLNDRLFKKYGTLKVYDNKYGAYEVDLNAKPKEVELIVSDVQRLVYGNDNYGAYSRKEKPTDNYVIIEFLNVGKLRKGKELLEDVIMIKLDYDIKTSDILAALNCFKKLNSSDYQVIGTTIYCKNKKVSRYVEEVVFRSTLMKSRKFNDEKFLVELEKSLKENKIPYMFGDDKTSGILISSIDKADFVKVYENAVIRYS